MVERIVPRAHSVAEIFSDTYRLALPYFQRGYAWQTEHVERLLAGIRRHADGKGVISWYPLGTIILVKPTDRPDAYVVDGHQRLITLTILIAVLRDLETDPTLRARLRACIREAEDGGRPRYRLAARESERKCLEDIVEDQRRQVHMAESAGGEHGLERGAGTGRLRAGASVDASAEADLSSDASPGGDEPGGDTTYGERNILENRDFLQHQITLLDDEARRRLARFVLDHCIVVLNLVDSEAAGEVVFSTMHDTGLRPSLTDMLKAKVLGCIAPDDREDCQTVWEQLDARLGKDGFDALLGHILLARRKVFPQQQMLHALVEKAFDVGSASGAKAFVEEHLAVLGRHFLVAREALLRPGALPDAAGRRLQYLELVRSHHDTWMTALLCWMERMGPGHASTAAFVRRLEALAWVVMICGLAPERRNKRYRDLIEEIEAGRALQPGGQLTLEADDIQKVRHRLSQPKFTERPYKMMLLQRINCSFEGDETLLALPALATTEHIYPSRPAPTSRWVTDFGPSTKAARYRNMLGNLALLRKEEQLQTRNLDYGRKRPVLAASTFAMTRHVAESPLWRPVDVTRRTQELIDVLMRSWGLA